MEDHQATDTLLLGNSTGEVGGINKLSTSRSVFGGSSVNTASDPQSRINGDLDFSQHNDIVHEGFAPGRVRFFPLVCAPTNRLEIWGRLILREELEDDGGGNLSRRENKSTRRIKCMDY